MLLLFPYLNYLWKIFFSLQENPAFIRYMGVRQMIKAGSQKQECSASARIYSITPWEVETMKRFAALILTLTLLMTAMIPTALADDYATATVKGGWLRLRDGASTDAKTISA